MTLRRTEMKRGQGFLPHVFPLDPKNCTVCGRLFVPGRPMQGVCSQRCAMKKVRADNEAKKEEIKARRKVLDETIPKLIKLAQKDFNAYIRERDKHQPCICCGKPLGDGEIGGRYDCGHYRSRGAASALRFDERNAHAQRKYCNRHKAGNAVDYRIGLVARIGLDAVEQLEAANAVHKWTADELRAVRATYKLKLKQLKEQA